MTITFTDLPPGEKVNGAPQLIDVVEQQFISQNRADELFGFMFLISYLETLKNRLAGKIDDDRAEILFGDDLVGAGTQPLVDQLDRVVNDIIHHSHDDLSSKTGLKGEDLDQHVSVHLAQFLSSDEFEALKRSFRKLVISIEEPYQDALYPATNKNAAGALKALVLVPFSLIMSLLKFVANKAIEESEKAPSEAQRGTTTPSKKGWKMAQEAKFVQGKEPIGFDCTFCSAGNVIYEDVLHRDENAEPIVARCSSCSKNLRLEFGMSFRGVHDDTRHGFPSRNRSVHRVVPMDS